MAVIWFVAVVAVALAAAATYPLPTTGRTAIVAAFTSLRRPRSTLCTVSRHPECDGLVDDANGFATDLCYCHCHRAEDHL